MLAVIAADPELTAVAIAERFGIGERQAYRLLVEARKPRVAVTYPPLARLEGA